MKMKKTEEVDHVAYVTAMTQEQFDIAVKQGVQEQLKRKRVEGEPQRFCHRFAKFGFCKFREGCAFVHCNNRAVLAKAGYEAPPEEFWSRKRGNNAPVIPPANTLNNEPVMTMLASMVESFQKVAESFKGATTSTAQPTAKKNLKTAEMQPSGIT